ncbi:hypothetical protein [Streptomyces cirratus]|uniref:hypothetical protein n=1 Tax=Streptomyces cirratus TaxID=68187 RepID=UPI00360E387E
MPVLRGLDETPLLCVVVARATGRPRRARGPVGLLGQWPAWSWCRCPRAAHRVK